MVYRTVPFSLNLNDPTPTFKVTLFFDAEYLINGTRYRHSFKEILIRTYTRPTQRSHFERPWVRSKLFNDTKRRAVSLRQPSFLFQKRWIIETSIQLTSNKKLYDLE